MPEHCEWCGRELKLSKHFDGLGYRGRGLFCTQSCGWHWAVNRIRPGAFDKQAPLRVRSVVTP